MDPTYVDVMETSDLAYVMLVYVLHAVVAVAHAGLAGFLIVTGIRGAGAVRVVLGLLLLAPVAFGAPAVVSIAAATAACIVLARVDRRLLPVSTLHRFGSRAAVAAAGLAAVFMLWEREDNLTLTTDLLRNTIEFRDEEISWQQDHDPESPKVGDLAPDFELEDPTGTVQVRLSDFRDKRPVVLVFGSYT